MSEFYFPSFKSRAASGFYDRSWNDALSRKVLIKDIADGQFDNLDLIFCGSLETGRFTDVSKEIADEVLTFCLHESGMPHWELRGWLEEQLGVMSVQEALQELELVEG